MASNLQFINQKSAKHFRQRMSPESRLLNPRINPNFRGVSENRYSPKTPYMTDILENKGFRDFKDLG